MGSDKQPETSSLRATVKAKIDAWTAVLASLDAALAMEGIALPAANGTVGTPHALPVGVFRDKGVKEAIVIYLEATRRKQTNKEITAGLHDGGIATTSTNFDATVATALLRLKNEGVVLRFPDGWDLAASYRDSLRARLEKDSNPRKPAKRASGKRTMASGNKTKANRAPSKQRPAPKAEAVPAKAESIDSRIAAHLKAHPGERFTSQAIRDTLRETDGKVVGLAIARLARYGKVVKDENGLYSAA